MFDIRFWIGTALCAAIVAIVASARGMRNRGWLLGFVVLSWVVSAGFYLPVALTQMGRLPAAAYREVMSVAAVPLGLAGIAAWALLLVYAIKAKAGAAEVAALRRAEFERVLNTDGEIDLVDLSEHGVVAVSGTGRDITQVVASMKNLSARPLRVVVTPGTCFTSSGSHQNMVAVDTTRFALQPDAAETVTLRAACVNADRPIPTGSDRFHGVFRGSETLTRFLQHAASASAMVRQAGVWAITDNYSGSDVQAHLVARNVRLGTQAPAVSEADIAQARAILDAIGARHRL